MQRKRTYQTADLRTPVIYKERAFPNSYETVHGPKKITANSIKMETGGLDIGSQAKLQSAALLSLENGNPINTLITVRSSVYPGVGLDTQDDPGHHDQVKSS